MDHIEQDAHITLPGHIRTTVLRPSQRISWLSMAPGTDYATWHEPVTCTAKPPESQGFSSGAK